MLNQTYSSIDGFAPFKPTIIIISGPSGVGKGSIIKQILPRVDNVHLSVSATTRPKRIGEVHKREYLFLTDEAFDQEIKANAFLEWCHVHHHRYGTLLTETQRHLNLNQSVLLEIDVQGAKKVMDFCSKHNQSYLSIFIIPPTLSVIESRLNIRQTEPPEVIKRRVARAAEELEEKSHYHFVVINDRLKDAVEAVYRIMCERGAC